MTKNSGEKLNKVFLYSIFGIKNKSAVKIKPVGGVLVPEGEKINDEFVKTLNLGENLKGHVFICNLSDSFLVSTKKYPYMYVIIDYYKSLFRCCLFKFFVYFTVEDDFNSEKDFINAEIKGKFSYEVSINNSSRELSKKISQFDGKNKMIDSIEDILKSQSIKPIIDELIKKAEKTREEKYGSMFKDVKIPKVTFSLKDIE